jgi:hypothetical protein
MPWIEPVGNIDCPGIAGGSDAARSDLVGSSESRSIQTLLCIWRI